MTDKRVKKAIWL